MARAFELQHFWRVLHDRYGDALDGRKARLETAFAPFLDVSPDTVHSDLQMIGRRLGPDWHLAGHD